MQIGQDAAEYVDSTPFCQDLRAGRSTVQNQAEVADCWQRAALPVFRSTVTEPYPQRNPDWLWIAMGALAVIAATRRR